MGVQGLPLESYTTSWVPFRLPVDGWGTCAIKSLKNRADEVIIHSYLFQHIKTQRTYIQL